MYKFLKSFSFAVIVMVALGTTPFAKKTDVHNKAPGITVVADVIESSYQAVLPEVIIETPASLDQPAVKTPVVQYAVLYTESEGDLIPKNKVGLKPPNAYTRSKYFYTLTDFKINTDYKYKSPAWKDLHRRSQNI